MGARSTLEYFLANGKLSLRDELIWDLLYVNILWGLVNLLPIYPLDGGQIARELFTLRNPRARHHSIAAISVGAAVLVAVYALAARAILHVHDVWLSGVRQLSDAAVLSKSLAVNRSSLIERCSRAAERNRPSRGMR